MRTYFTALFAVMLALAVPAVMWAQPGSDAIDLAVPSDYRIAGITVLGAEYTDVQAVKLFSGLQVGDEVVIVSIEAGGVARGGELCAGTGAEDKTNGN